MSYPKGVPDPPNSPNEKFEFAKALDPEDKEAFKQDLIRFQAWVNQHTHPGIGAGGGDPTEPQIFTQFGVMQGAINDWYDSDLLTWRALASGPIADGGPGGATRPGTVRTHVVGGQLSDGSFTGRHDVYNHETDTWSIAASLPFQAATHCVWVGDILYALGGQVGTGGSILHYAYDPDANSWTRVADLPEQRYSHAVVEHKGKIHMVGGLGSSGWSSNRHDVYDPISDTWSSSAVLPANRDGGALIVFEGYAYWIGGRYLALDSGGSFNYRAEMWRYNFSSNVWEALADYPIPTTGLRAIVVGVTGRIHTVGGTTGSGGTRAHRSYNVDSDTWNAEPESPSMVSGYAIGGA